MTGITSINRDYGVNPSIVRVTSTDTLATVAGADYVTAQASNIEVANSGAFEWLVGDLVAIAAFDGTNFFNFDGDNFATFIPLPVGNGNVSLPVVGGDFAVFDGTSGALYDAGYLPSNAAKTTVAMLNGAVVANHIATFTDTAGTLSDNPTVAITGGSLQAGLSGTAGTVTSYPSTATKGYLQLAAVANTGNTATVISNDAMGQASTVNIPDPGNVVGQFLVGATATPFTSGDILIASGTSGLVGDSGILGSGTTANALTVLMNTGTLSSANLEAMYATPISLLGAVTGKGYFIHKIQFEYIYVTTPYATNGGSIYLTYGSSAHAAADQATGAIALTGLTDQSASTISTIGGTTVGIASSAIKDVAVYISNTTAALATGNGTASYTIWYSLISIT